MGAISLSKYVQIGTKYSVADGDSRSLGGLVITAKELLADVDSDIKAAYNAGGILSFDNIADVKAYFGDGNEASFAINYFGYVSPAGTVPQQLCFAKLLSTTTTVNDEPVTTYEDAVDAYTRVVQSPIFATLTFLNSPAHTFTTAELKEVVTANEGNGDFWVIINDIRGSQLATAVKSARDEYGTAAKCAAFVSGANPWSAFMPMAIFAATAYDTGAATTQMFKQFSGETATVTTDSDYTLFTDNSINFYGKTQAYGSELSFYQPGKNLDGAASEVFCNELWFRSRCKTALLNLLVQEDKLPANNVGVTLVDNILNAVFVVAQNNGVFSPSTMSDTIVGDVLRLLEYYESDASVSDVSARIEEDGYYYLSAVKTINGKKTIQYHVLYGSGEGVRFIKGDDIVVR